MNPQMPWQVVEPQGYLQDRFPGLVVHGEVAALRQIANRRKNVAHRPIRQPLCESVHLSR